MNITQAIQIQLLLRYLLPGIEAKRAERLNTQPMEEDPVSDPDARNAAFALAEAAQKRLMAGPAPVDVERAWDAAWLARQERGLLDAAQDRPIVTTQAKPARRRGRQS